MKRLKNKLLAMEPGETGFAAIYEGSMAVPTPNGPELNYDSAYWRNDIAYEFTRTHKLALDKPTVTIKIPVKVLGIEGCGDKKTAADYCLRAFMPYTDNLNAQLYNRSRPDSENGKYCVYSPGGEVTVRNSCFIALCPQKYYENASGILVYPYSDETPLPPLEYLCIRIQVQLPRKKIRKTIQMLTRDLPDAAERFAADFDTTRLNAALVLAQKQRAVREWLKKSEYCAFIANGSVLPRSKGTQLPMENAVPFRSAPEDEIEIEGIHGMGIHRGVTVITGGGYSGKTTLLDAISAGIYDHVAGDGRELCITDETAVKISAEDGRSVKSLNISPFIGWIPGGDTSDFSTERASGSTSQAANIMEAVDCGSKLLLIDEDKSATNFMIRDAMMKELIEKEPITPFTERVNGLLCEKGVSTILVIGGSGEYLRVAHRVYLMDDFLIRDVTKKAKEISDRRGGDTPLPTPAVWTQSRTLLSDGFTPYPKGSGSERLLVSDMGYIIIGDERIDIRMLQNIISQAQLNAICFMLRELEVTNDEPKIDLEKILGRLYHKIETEGLDCVYSSFFTACERFMDLPRKAELTAVINRMRGIKFKRG